MERKRFPPVKCVTSFVVLCERESAVVVSGARFIQTDAPDKKMYVPVRTYVHTYMHEKTKRLKQVSNKSPPSCVCVVLDLLPSVHQRNTTYVRMRTVPRTPAYTGHSKTGRTSSNVSQKRV